MSGAPSYWGRPFSSVRRSTKPLPAASAATTAMAIMQGTA